jgi:regulator of sirC expression with transglutaminase-like and TPR domain
MDHGSADATAEALAHFAETVAGDPRTIALDEAALAMSGVLQPGLDLVGWLAALDAVAAACPAPTRSSIVQHLLVNEGFGQPPTLADAWRSSCVDRVVVTRRGLPITVGVVLIEVARRLGVELVGVGMPAHFLVGDPHDDDWFVDPIGGSADRGEMVLDRTACRALLERKTAGRVRWRETHLDAVPNRLVIVRMLNNLRSVLSARADPVRHALVMRMRVAVPELRDERDDAVRAQAVLN